MSSPLMKTGDSKGTGRTLWKKSDEDPSDFSDGSTGGLVSLFILQCPRLGQNLWPVIGCTKNIISLVEET